MRGFLKTVALFAVAVAASCIEPRELTPDIAGDIIAIEVEGQTRTPSVNTVARTVSIELEEGRDLTAVRVTRIELVETATCDIKAGSVIDLSSPLKIAVTTVARYEWTITATNFVDSRRALPGGSFDEWSSTGTRPTWNPWPVAASGENLEEGEWEITRWWDTGNKGVTILYNSNSTPTEPGEGAPANPAGRAARLETAWAALKVAGGNIFFGRFGSLTTDLNATCDIGHRWQTKPRALKGWYKYFPQPVDRVGNSRTNDNNAKTYLDLHPYKNLGFDDWMGSMDSLHVNIALWASPDGENKPFTVNTSPRSFVDFSRDVPGVIAYGSFVSGDVQADWKEFTLQLEYLVDGPLPENTQLFLQVTSSKNCNYFIAGTTGGGPDGRTGSLMYVDELELVYD